MLDMAADAAAIRVVLADDNPLFRDALATAFEADGRFDVVGCAADGAEALELGRRLEPDVVVMDVEMPRMDGIEATRLLHESTPEARVLLVSGREPDVVGHRAEAVGARAIEKKSIDDIVETVARLAAEAPSR
jgi:DNA-binding NarL/FixJ family response regulator